MEGRKSIYLPEELYLSDFTAFDFELNMHHAQELEKLMDNMINKYEFEQESFRLQNIISNNEYYDALIDFADDKNEEDIRILDYNNHHDRIERYCNKKKATKILCEQYDEMDYSGVEDEDYYPVKEDTRRQKHRHSSKNHKFR